MRKFAFLSAICLLTLSQNEAFAGPWDDVLQSATQQAGQTVNDGAIFTYGVNCSGNSSSLTPESYNNGIVPFSPTTCQQTSIFFVSLQQLARQGDVVALQGQMSANFSSLSALQTSFTAFQASTASQFTDVNAEISRLQQLNALTNKQIWIGSALAASLVNVSPADGKTNRIGTNIATVQGQNAISINYSHVGESVDFNAGVAFSTSNSRYATARVGIGYSW
jgi:hypothetical protein